MLTYCSFRHTGASRIVRFGVAACIGLIMGAVVLGCGGTDISAGSSTPARVTISGTGYQVTLPEGWRDDTTAARERERAHHKPATPAGPDLELAVSSPHPSVFTVRSLRDLPFDIRTESDIFKRPPLLKRLLIPSARNMARQIANGDGTRATIDGERGVLASYLARGARRGALGMHDLTVVIHDRSAYAITLQAEIALRKPERDELLEGGRSILASWRWNSR